MSDAELRKPRAPINGNSKEPPARAQEPKPELSAPELVREDVLSDVLDSVQPRFVVNLETYLPRLWEANPAIYQVLSSSKTLEDARQRVFDYLSLAEQDLFSVENDLHILEKTTIREAIQVMRSICGPINEKRTRFSALECLWKLASGQREDINERISIAFLMEFEHLLLATAGKSNIYREQEEVHRHMPSFIASEGRDAAVARNEMLEDMGANLRMFFRRYPSGIDDEVIAWRRLNRDRILRYFDGSLEDWNDYRWHLKHVIKDARTLLDLIDMHPERRRAIEQAEQYRLPFGITPYYLSLMERNPSLGYDRAVRAQVIPPPELVEEMVAHTSDRAATFDFMGEHDTSPADLITRRYPLICILKPYNTCAQICVYCQRNWEIDEVLAPNAQACWQTIEKSIEFIAQHKAMGEVLVTGGDPAVMNNRMIEKVLSKLADIDHIYRIRFGTRTPVVLPQRFTDDFCAVLGKYHVPGRREIAVVTHAEHSYEITPEMMRAVHNIKKHGINVYNQAVFTVENSRRFELARLRRDLRLIGVDPYYTFNMKGKNETRRLMVPIARILQERKEEARLLPGLDRSDEPVFNVPRLGKNDLRAMQDHRIVMILPNGSRVYEFHPWEKNITPMPPYNYVDVPIYDYLEQLATRGENIRDYRTIWYYY